MTYPHIHLLLNHFPIATLLFGFCILVIGRIQHNEGVVRVALGLLIVGGFVGTASFFTGDPAADIIKTNSTFSAPIVHEHELAATFGLWATIITAVVASGGLFLSRKKGAVPKRYLVLIFIINFWALTVIARTNYLGGQISHPEIRPIAPTSP
jgi:uncharacterized membrane protein YoaK (UPF0700 family)